MIVSRTEPCVHGYAPTAVLTSSAKTCACTWPPGVYRCLTTQLDGCIYLTQTLQPKVSAAGEHHASTFELEMVVRSQYQLGAGGVATSLRSQLRGCITMPGIPNGVKQKRRRSCCLAEKPAANCITGRPWRVGNDFFWRIVSSAYIFCISIADEVCARVNVRLESTSNNYATCRLLCPLPLKSRTSGSSTISQLYPSPIFVLRLSCDRIAR